MVRVSSLNLDYTLAKKGRIRAHAGWREFCVAALLSVLENRRNSFSTP